MIASKAKIGLLPLYLELYDRVAPDLRPRIEKFLNIIKKQFEKQNIKVISSIICRLKEEFKEAIRCFEKEKVDAIVTLHLAYSPSLESVEYLAKTNIPIIILDTTPFYEFVESQDSDAIMLNHGIHGVQDLCNMLLRHGKKFILEVGHWERSDVLKRVCNDIKAAKIASRLSNIKVGSVGGSFEGMGDFIVDCDKLKNDIGINVTVSRVEDLTKFLPEVNSLEVDREIKQLLINYDGKSVNLNSLKKTVCSGIALRKWIEENKLDAVTVNFTKFNRNTKMPTIPFLEAELLLSRGFGYAGEGDVLTSAFVGALNSVYDEVTFTEMFCPDWKESIIFLSHMGEANINLFSKKAVLIEKNLPFIDVDSPVIAFGRLKKGKVTIANLAPTKNSFSLIVCKGEMLDIEDEKNYKDSIRGWFKPDIPVADFLYLFSKAGGTHHSALVYGGDDVAKQIMTFGEIMGWKTIEIQ